MKREKNVFEKFLDKEKLREIIIEASKNKRKRRDVKRVLNRLDDYVEKLYRMLCEENYRISPVRVVKRTEMANGKPKIRNITISPFYPNQVLDHLFRAMMEERVVKSMYLYSVSGVKGRGTKAGKRFVERNIGKYKYFIKFDIYHWYDSVKSDVSYSVLYRYFKDKRFLRFAKTILDFYGTLPVGSCFSPVVGNLMLQEMDHQLKERYKIPFVCRYADDILLMGNNKRTLNGCYYYITRILQGLNLRLKRKERAHDLSERRISFLGYLFGKEKVRLRTHIFRKINRCVKKIKRAGNVCFRQAQSLLSRIGGFLKNTTEGYRYYRNKIFPVVKIGTLRKIVSVYAVKRKEVAL